MIELLILACLTIVALLAVIAWQAYIAGRVSDAVAVRRAAEQLAWREERRFLIDRAIARHAGEVIALEREDTRKSIEHPAYGSDDRPVRPLLEGLS